MLLRELVGAELRRVRTERRLSLRVVAGEAAVSVGYLSEVERGAKEASSEVLAAVCRALDLPRPALLEATAHRATVCGAVPLRVVPTDSAKPAA